MGKFDSGLREFTEFIYDDNGDGTGTYYAKNRKGDIITSGTDIFTILRAVTDAWNSYGGRVLISTGEFTGSSTRTDGTSGAIYLIEGPDGKPFHLQGMGIKQTRLKYTGSNVNARMLQTQPSVSGTNNPNSASTCAIRDIDFDVNLSGYAVPAINAENVYQRDIRYIRVLNNTAPNPPAAGSIGLKLYYSGGERSTVSNVTCTRFQRGFDIACDHLFMYDCVASLCSDRAFSTTNSVFSNDYFQIHSFSCGGNAFYIDNNATDTHAAHYPVIWSLLDEGDRGDASFTAKGPTIYNNASGAIVHYGDIRQRSVPAGTALFGGNGSRNIMPITCYAPQSVTGFGTSGEYPAGFVGYLGGVKNEFGLGTSSPLGTESTNNQSAADKFYGNYATAASTGSDAGISWANTMRGDTQPDIVFKFSLPSITSIRFFAGVSDQSLTTMLGSDTPTGNYVGLSFSTPRSDTNFKIMSRDGSTNSTVEWTRPTGGYAADTNNYAFGMNIADTRYTLWLMTPTNNIFRAFHATTSNTPAATILMNIMIGVETETNGVRNLRLTNVRVMY